MWWHTTVIVALGRLRQENQFKVSRGDTAYLRSVSAIVKPCLKEQTNKQNVNQLL
jgi:hypothetical protein